MAELLTIKGDLAFRINAYRKSAKILDSLDIDISEIYFGKSPSSPGPSGSPTAKGGLVRLKELGFGEKNAKKIEEYLRRGRIKSFEDLKEETAIRQIVTYYFQSKGLSLQELKENAKKRKIIYSRFTKPAKQLLELAGSIEKAKEAIDKVATWANSRKLDYAIETVFKKWLELDRLKPKEIVKKPFYKGDPMVWAETKRKWYVIDKYGNWLEFADKDSTMEWRTIQ